MPIILGDSSIGLLVVGCFEGWFSTEHRIEDYTGRPHINRVGVAVFLVDYLRGDVVWRATDSPLLFVFKVKFGSEAEVTYFDLHLLRQHNVAQFEISVHNSMRMQIPKTL